MICLGFPLEFNENQPHRHLSVTEKYRESSLRQGSKPTIRDVAAAAGVSPTTVSYVLTGRTGSSTRISQPTRDRVHAAVRDLGYVPNRAARGMRRGRTDVVAVAITDLEDSWDRALAAAAVRLLPGHGYQPVILVGEAGGNLCSPVAPMALSSAPSRRTAALATLRR
ncbi:LacI family DNA-binding transcriptional regulator [Arthrobacter sp. H16F315]|uniref:LacI family DNA-binding transcriptional regulator n=1 Tax=Arthrobacter sp. H16F315 TaxID=2955314 RepID=UPI0021E65C84|nr:LacI family DNA-binding transcriptional regulator [Arthrobacter sp. H16F315]MDD1476045.1 LacI family DNA-binding transcriptional regulator [Arthrobacter sp. H16F315]